MLDAFKVLQKTAPDVVIGRTPRDWQLEPPGSYLEIHVRPKTSPEAKPWRDLEQEASEPITSATRSGLSHQMAAATGGFRNNEKRAELAFAKGFESRLEKVIRPRTREELLAEHQKGLDVARRCLVVGVWVCQGDPQDSAAKDVERALAAVTAAEEGPDLERARKAFEDVTSPERLLLPQSEPLKRRELTDEEMDSLFTAELAELAPGESATILPDTWSPGFSKDWTLSRGLLNTIKRLADYGASGHAAIHRAEKEAVKKAPTSGRSAAPPQEKKPATSRKSTGESLPHGSAVAVASGGLTSAADAKTTAPSMAH